MRIRRFHLLILPLALWLLVAQALPVLWRMHCVVSDRSVVSWGRAKSCLPPGKTRTLPAVQAYCCEFTHVAAERAEYVKENVTVPLENSMQNVLDAIVIDKVALAVPRTLFRSRPPPGLPADRPVVLRRLLI